MVHGARIAAHVEDHPSSLERSRFIESEERLIV
jgi:hypothetical protein